MADGIYHALFRPVRKLLRIASYGCPVGNHLRHEGLNVDVSMSHGSSILLHGSTLGDLRLAKLPYSSTGYVCAEGLWGFGVWGAFD